MQQGGNAIDAGVAAVFAASVVEISHFGFGGESPTMIDDAKSHEIIVINGQGPAPKAATPDLFKAEGRPATNGPLAATIPAVMDAMAVALETKETMRLEQVMQPAIELADGFPMYEFLRGYLISERQATERYDWSKNTYYPDGRVPEVGEMFRQPNLAKTMRAIVEAEKASFEKSGDRVPVSVRNELTARGHTLKVLGPYAMGTGVVAVGVNPQTGTLRGGADPRRERYIFGW